VWTQDSILAKQVLCCLSHAYSSFCSGYFGGGGLVNYLPGLPSNHNPPDLSLPSIWDYRYSHQHHQHPANTRLSCFISSFFVFVGIRVWTQDFVLVRQGFYHLSHATSLPLLFSQYRELNSEPQAC
jgi:hypothetical protein